MNNGEDRSPQPEKHLGLVCPRCECCHFLVLETRPTTDGRIRRLRGCRNCGKHVRTYEEIDADDPLRHLFGFR